MRDDDRSSWVPLSKATAQLWGLEQRRTPREPRRRAVIRLAIGWVIQLIRR